MGKYLRPNIVTVIGRSLKALNELILIPWEYGFIDNVYLSQKKGRPKSPLKSL